GVFAPELNRHSLVSNKSIWRQFPLLANGRWSVGNVILIGDALRTIHFSIGSGTRLAFEDAIALDRAFGEAGEDVPRMLAAFERADINSGEESTNDVAACDRKIEMRGVRLVVMDGDASGARPAQIIARQRL